MEIWKVPFSVNVKGSEVLRLSVLWGGVGERRACMEFSASQRMAIQILVIILCIFGLELRGRVVRKRSASPSCGGEGDICVGCLSFSFLLRLRYALVSRWTVLVVFTWTVSTTSQLAESQVCATLGILLVGRGGNNQSLFGYTDTTRARQNSRRTSSSTICKAKQS